MQKIRIVYSVTGVVVYFVGKDGEMVPGSLTQHRNKLSAAKRIRDWGSETLIETFCDGDKAPETQTKKNFLKNFFG